MAAAAYRSGSLLKDERTGRIHRYDKRTGVADTFILAPNSAPEKFLSRAVLWNAAEASETRKNSRVAREVILALPHELTHQQRQALARDMAMYLVERYRVAVDVAIHSPCEGDGHDPRNHHAHLLFTTRELTNEGFDAKTRILDDKQAGPQEVELLREVWETLANDSLARAGFSDVKIDRRTLEGQGIDRIPQTHIGPKAKASEEAEKDEEDEEDEGKRDGEGKKGSAGGASGKGDKSGSGDAFPPKIAKDSETKKDREAVYKTIDQGRRRVDFVEEIKRLNERRAAFSDIPLKDQIAEIEKLIEKLDHRVSQLETLKERTSLGARILSSLTDLVKFSKDLIFGREKYGEAVKLSTEERATRAERQREHYGRTYRAGLHERIQEMRTNLDQLEQLKVSYTAYKGFVETIERQIAFTQPSITTTKEKAEGLKARFKIEPAKIVTPVESRLKLTLKADMLREITPPQYKPKDPIISRTEPTPTLKTELNRTAAPPRPPINLTSNFREQIIPPTREQSPNIASYKQPIKLDIKELSRSIEERVRASTTRPEPRIEPRTNPAERKIWFTPASEKTRPMQESIYREMREQRRANPEPQPEPERPDPDSLRGQFRQSAKPEEPPRHANYEQARQRTREEAQTKRDNVDPKYRAEPYEQEPPHRPEPEQPEARTSEQPRENSARQEWKEQAEPKSEQPHQEQTEKPRRSKMSEGFNKSAANEDFSRPNDPNTRSTPETEPEADFP